MRTWVNGWATWERNLYVLWLIEFVAFVGLSMIVPFLPLYIRQLGLTEADDVARWSGLVLSAPFMLSFVATPIWGALGDRLGHKLMVVRALLGSSVCYLGMSLVGSVYGLFGCRLALGAISGVLAAGMALVSANVPDDRRGYALGLLQGVVPAAGLVGPLLGGVLGDVIGYREIFVLVGVICATGGLAAARLLAEPREPAALLPARGRVRDNFAFAWRRRDLRDGLVTLCLSQMLVTTVQPIFVLYVEQLGVESRLLATATGVLFAATGVTALVAAPWWGRRADQVGAGPVLTMAVLGSGLVLLLQGVVTDVRQLFVVRILYGCFVAGIVPPVLGFISGNGPTDRRGGLMGLSSSAAMLGNLLGPLLGGALGGHLGLRSVFFASGLMMLGLTWFSYRLVPMQRS